MPKGIAHVHLQNYSVDLTIYQFGHHQCDPLYNNGPHKYKNYLFHYVLSGRGKVNICDGDGQTVSYSVAPGQGFLISPNQVASYFADAAQPWRYCWIEFSGLKANELIARAGLTWGQPIYKSQDEHEHTKMRDALNFIVHNPEASPYELTGQCYLFLSGMAESSVQRKKAARSSLRDFYATEILAYIEKNYHENIQVKDVAAACNLDRSHLGKIFKIHVGTTLQAFLREYRVSKACELMTTSHYTIGQISAMVGYPNMFHFSRMFKSIMGQPPSQWRTENRLR